MENKKNKHAFISMVLGAVYMVYIISYLIGVIPYLPNNSGLPIALMIPHVICSGTALLFNIWGYFKNTAKGMLVAGILYAGSAVLLVPFFVFIPIRMILSFVAYAKIKKTEYTK